MASPHSRPTSLRIPPPRSAGGGASLRSSEFVNVCPRNPIHGHAAGSAALQSRSYTLVATFHERLWRAALQQYWNSRASRGEAIFRSIANISAYGGASPCCVQGGRPVRAATPSGKQPLTLARYGQAGAQKRKRASHDRCVPRRTPCRSCRGLGDDESRDGHAQCLGLFLPPMTQALALSASDFTFAIAVRTSSGAWPRRRWGRWAIAGGCVRSWCWGRR